MSVIHLQPALALTPRHLTGSLRLAPRLERRTCHGSVMFSVSGEQSVLAGWWKDGPSGQDASYGRVFVIDSAG